MKKLNVLFASFEASPFIKTGGLGDVAAALPGAVSCPDIEVRVVLPKLAQIGQEYVDQMRFICSFYVPLGWRNQYCGLFELQRGGVTWYFLDNEYYFKRGEPYGYFDDAERMAFFSKAICECCRYLPDFFPDVLHCNDWHTALAPVFLREMYRYAPDYAQMKTVYTIHNLKFQGQYDPRILGDVLGLYDIPAARDQLLRDYGNCVNFMAGAVHYADRVTTVSPTYAREICTPYFGEGMQDLFIERSGVLSGILNGIDTASYNPSTDPALAANFNDPIGKTPNKTALQAEVGLEVDPEVPLCAAVSRLTEQKGFDLLNAVAEEMLDVCQIVILGTGERSYEDYYRYLAHRHPGRFSAQILFSEPLSRRIYAGADLFLMPSRFEPCGLSQMISMRYGTIPVVRRTGGLADSVMPYNPETGEGTGFGFNNYNAHELLFTVQAACRLHNDSPAAWENLQRAAMAQDFSWDASAIEYRKLYRGLFE
ncbi:MAG: glycogen synthase GlgA [Oscillospiraceae bacterium]|nr:glycogen synthase GlgA [Oscillospiraceae bacterium]